MVFDIVEREEGEDYYVVTLTFRPEGDFAGTPGEEQFFIEKEGRVAYRQVCGLPKPERKRRSPLLAVVIGLVVVGAIGGGVAFAILSFGGGNGARVPAASATESPPVAAVASTDTPTATPLATTVPPPTPTVTPTTLPPISNPTPLQPVPTPPPTSMHTATVIPPTDFVGTWLRTGKNSYLWHIRDDKTFDNDRGSKGVWSIDRPFLILIATNQGSDPSTWRLRLTDSGNTLEGTWSVPSGNRGELVLQKQRESTNN